MESDMDSSSRMFASRTWGDLSNASQCIPIPSACNPPLEEEQMCRLIDNLAVSPDLATDLHSLTSGMAHSSDALSPSTLTDCGPRGRTDSSDSGVADCTDFVTPSLQLVHAVLGRLEQYFSDEHLRTDTFLLKHIRRSKEGFVSLKLVSSFQKMKSLTKDWRVVAYCIQNHSTQLQLNETNSKVRRLNPLPEDLLQMPISKKKAHTAAATEDLNHGSNSGCAQFVEDLERRWPRIVFAFEPAATITSPSQLQCMVRTHCERYGAISSVKLLRPERAARLDLIRFALAARGLDIRRWRQLGALVEFTCVEHAQRALAACGSAVWSTQITLCSLSMRPLAASATLLSTSPLGSQRDMRFDGNNPRPRNRSDIGPLEQLSGGLLSSSLISDPFGGSSGTLCSAPTLADVPIGSFTRPRASTISHFATSAFSGSRRTFAPDAPSLTGHGDWNVFGFSNPLGDNNAPNPVGPIARPKSNSISVHHRASPETTDVVGNANKLSLANLLRLPKGPDNAGRIGFDMGSRSRSTSSPSNMMQLFGL